MPRPPPRRVLRCRENLTFGQLPRLLVEDEHVRKRAPYVHCHVVSQLPLLPRFKHRDLHAGMSCHDLPSAVASDPVVLHGGLHHARDTSSAFSFRDRPEGSRIVQLTRQLLYRVLGHPFGHLDLWYRDLSLSRGPCRASGYTRSPFAMFTVACGAERDTPLSPHDESRTVCTLSIADDRVRHPGWGVMDWLPHRHPRSATHQTSTRSCVGTAEPYSVGQHDSSGWDHRHQSAMPRT
jgi:hypothetical protein